MEVATAFEKSQEDGMSSGQPTWTSWFTGHSISTATAEPDEQARALSSSESAKRGVLSSTSSSGNGHRHRASSSVDTRVVRGECACSPTSSSSSSTSSTSESGEKVTSNGRARRSRPGQGEDDWDEDSLMWEAQMALISHEYKSAIRKLKKAVRYGSPSACLSLANILTKGLTCKDDLTHHTVHANPVQAAEYYILGLELLHRRDVQARENGEEEGEELSDGDMETLQDLTTGLCSLYRLGKVRPHGLSRHLSRRSTGDIKGKGKETTFDEKSSHDVEEERPEEEPQSLWNRGGDATGSLINRVENLLGITREASPARRPQTLSHTSSTSTNSDEGSSAGESACTDSTAQPAKANGHGHRNVNGHGKKITKSVSFSKLPPKLKYRSSLDPMATRQARAALIHLYYISALVAFSAASPRPQPQSKSQTRSSPASPEAEDEKAGTLGDDDPEDRDGKECARLYWERILELSRNSAGSGSGLGGGSKEADELIGKAKIRLEMLVDPVQAQKNAVETALLAVSPGLPVSEKPAGQRQERRRSSILKTGPIKLDLPADAKDLTILHMLSPPTSSEGSALHINGFDFDSARLGPPLDLTKEAAPKQIELSETNGDATSSEAAPELTDDMRASAQGLASEISPKISPSADKYTPASPSTTTPQPATPEKPRNNGRPKAKFSIPDSPTSTIHSFSLSPRTDIRANLSVPSGVRPRDRFAQSRGISNASILSGVEGQAPKSTGLEAPWLLRRPSSSTSLSTHKPDFSKQKPAYDNDSAKDFSTQPARLATVYQGRPKLSLKPTLRDGAEKKWAPEIRSAPPITQKSDTTLLSDSADQVSLRMNDTNVASLPHASSMTSSRPAKSFSAAHFFPGRSGLRDRRGSSSSSLASLGMGIQKSFSSLRSFFVPSRLGQDQAIGETAIESDGEEAYPEDAGTRARREAAMAKQRQKEEDKARAERALQQKLQDVAKRHDEAVAEAQYWAGLDDESQPADSYEASLPGGEFDSAADAEDGMRQSPLEHAATPSEPYTPPAAESPTRQTDKAVSTPPSKSKFLRPLPYSIPSDRLVPLADSCTMPRAPPGTPQSAHRKGKRRARTPLGQGGLGMRASPSSGSSGAASPTELDENGEIPGPLKIDPLLAALEAASRVNVKTRCTVCGKSGVNFPKARDGRTYCSRECRVASRKEEAPVQSTQATGISA